MTTQPKTEAMLPLSLKAESDWDIEDEIGFIASTGGSARPYAFKIALRNELVNRWNEHSAHLALEVVAEHAKTALEEYLGEWDAVQEHQCPESIIWAKREVEALDEILSKLASLRGKENQ